MLAQRSPRIQPLDEEDPGPLTPPVPTSGTQQEFDDRTMEEQWPAPTSPIKPAGELTSFHPYEDDDDDARDPDDVFGPLRNRASALRGAAENGEAGAQVRLGYMYVDINDRNSAEGWFGKAARSHDPDAHYALGMLAKSGPEAQSTDAAEVEAAHAASARHLSRAAKQGHSWAAYHLGDAYARGVGVVRDLKIAERFLRSSAAAGCVPAMNALGACLERSARNPATETLDVPVDIFTSKDPVTLDNDSPSKTKSGRDRKLKDACMWYARAAKAGDRDAQCNLGRCHYLGVGVPRDPSRALDVWLLAADRGCPASCNNAAALLARRAADDPGEGVLALEAERLLLQAAELESTTARFNVAVIRSAGLGDVVKHEEEAIRQLRQAAEGGEPAANLALGDAYAAGKGVPRQSDKEAFRCYKVAAAAGEPDGQYRLGLCYERGKGCMGDATRALRLYDAAARAGHLAAAARAGALQTGAYEDQY